MSGNLDATTGGKYTKGRKHTTTQPLRPDVSNTNSDRKGRGSRGREGPEQRTLAKLKESDLDERDAEKMKLKPCTVAQAGKLPRMPEAAGDGFAITYFTPAGKPLPLTEMFRYRNLDTVRRTKHTEGFFVGKETQRELDKYLQPTGSEPRIYFPPLGNFDWPKIMADPQYDLFITEGEIKAACACKKSYPAIGDGGIWSFTNSKRGQRLIPDLEAFVWKGRNVTIVYDSDASINKQVALAQARFARELSNRGALVKAPLLPALGGNKTGWDDFLCRKTGLQEFQKLLDQTDLFHEIEELYRMNTELIFIEHPPFTLFYPLSENHPEDQRRYRMRTLLEMKAIKADRKIYIDNKPKPAAKAWFDWEGKNKADSICYEPGQPQRTGNQFNSWEGWFTEPKRGNVKPFLTLYDAMNSSLGALRMWPMQWFAYPIQYPGAKLSTALLFWGDEQGTGKTLLGQTVGYVYGNNAQKINSRDLKNPFNAWAQFKQFIRGEEITGGSSREVADMLKDLITGSDLQLNQKFLPIVTIRNTINLYLTSNHPDALYLTDKDRRYFVHEVPPHDLDAEFFTEYAAWLYDPETNLPRPEAVAAVHDYLLHVDLTGFNPHAHAPKTEAFTEMAAANDSEHLAWCKELRRSPDSILRTGINNSVVSEFKLWTAKDLLAIYAPYGENRRKPVTDKAMGLALRAAGFEKAAHGQTCPIEDRMEGKVWIIRDDPEFARMTKGEIGSHYQNERSLKTNGKKKRTKHTGGA